MNGDGTSSPPRRRRLRKSNLVLLIALGVCGAVLVGQALYAWRQTPSQDQNQPIIDLADRFGDMRVSQRTDGAYEIEVPTNLGVQRFTPEQFAQIIYHEKSRQEEAGWLFVIFNITTWWGLLWVSVGFFGQVFFTFRMVLQWLESEKAHQSVVPTSFWWGSLIGGAMLLTYFIWRKDAIGILGQSTGTFIYARNLWLIYFGSKGRGGGQTPQRRSTDRQPETPSPSATPGAPAADTGAGHP